MMNHHREFNDHSTVNNNNDSSSSSSSSIALLTNADVTVIFPTDFDISDLLERVPHYRFYIANHIALMDYTHNARIKSSHLFMIAMRSFDVSIINKISIIRENFAVPIIILTDKYDEVMALTVLKFGGNEYYSYELNASNLARLISTTLIKASIGYYKNIYVPKPINDSDSIVSDNSYRIANKIGNDLNIFKVFTPYEHKALQVLFENCGNVTSRQEISRRVHGRTSKNIDRTVDNIISRIRKKFRILSLDQYQIRSFNSIGYLFIGDNTSFKQDLDTAIDVYMKTDIGVK